MLLSSSLSSRLLIAFALLFGPYLVWSYFAYGEFFYTLEKGWRNVEGPAPGFDFYIVRAPVIFTWVAVIGLGIAAGIGGVRFLRDKALLTRGFADHFAVAGRSRMLVGFLWLWLLTGLVFFSRMPHKEPRYILPLAPPVLLLAGAGLAKLRRLPGKVLRPAGLGLLAAGMAAACWPSVDRLTDPFVDPGRPEELDASLFMNARFAPATPLYMNFNYPAFAYFTGFTIHELPIGGPEVYQAIDAMPPGGLLVAYRETESGEPTIEALDRNPRLAVVKAYSSLVIYRRR